MYWIHPDKLYMHIYFYRYLYLLAFYWPCTDTVSKMSLARNRWGKIPLSVQVTEMLQDIHASILGIGDARIVKFAR